MQKEDVSQNRPIQTGGSRHIHLSERAGELVDQTALGPPPRHNGLESPDGDSGAVSSLPRRISSSGLTAHPFLVHWVEALSLCSTSQSSVGPGAGALTLAEVICCRGDPGSAAGLGSPLAAARASLGIKPQDPEGEEGRRSESTVTPARDDRVQTARP